MKLSSLVLGPLAIVLSVAPAFSQTPASAEPPQSGYVSVAFGAIATAPVNPVFFAEYAENMGQNAQAYVNLSYMDNMMRANTRDALTAASASGSDRGVSVTGGGKFVKSTGVVRPYIGGGAGIVYITRTITDARLVFTDQAVFNDFGSSDSSLLSPSSVTKPLGEIIGGVGFNLGHTFVDAGYRYRRVFGLNQLDKYDFSQLTAGIGYRW